MNLRKLLIACIFAFSAKLALNAESIPVYLSPTDDSPTIGNLDALSLAVAAPWPAGSQLLDNWRPIYYRGFFEVYLDNNDIGKDMFPKPGAPYFLSPNKESTVLSIATKKDQTDIISVDTWFCKMRLETIIVGYIKTSESGVEPAITQTAPTSASQTQAVQPSAVREMVGILQKTGLLEKGRSGYDHKLVTETGKLLAFVDLSAIPDLVRANDQVGQKVRIEGPLLPNENGKTLILSAQTLKKVN